MQTGVAFAHLDLDDPERFVRLGKELGVSTFGLNVVLLRPGQRMRVHRHRHQEEAYLVLRGTLTLLIEEEEHVLQTGDASRVAPGVRRQLVNAGDELCAVLALGGANSHDGRDAEAFEAWSETVGREPRDVPLPDDL